MELNFKYTDGGVVKYLTLNVEEHPEFVLNYSSWSGTWIWRSGGGVGDEKRYFNYFSGNSNRWPYISVALNQFADWDGDNVLVLNSSCHFYNHVESTYEWGAWSNSKTLEFGESGTCLLNWYIFTDRSVNPPVDYIRANGLYDVRPAGGESNGANQPLQGAGMNPGYYPYSTADAPKMAFWLIRMYDDVATSDTYQQYFDCLLITIKGQDNGQGSSYQAGVQVFDMRLFEGAKKPVPPSKSTTQGNTPNGFRGGRDDYSDTDTISTISTHISYTANSATHGIHFYHLPSYADYDDFCEAMWSDYTWSQFSSRGEWNPVGGVLSFALMPCYPDHYVSTSTANIRSSGKELLLSANDGVEAITPPMSTAELTSLAIKPLEYSHSFLDWTGYTKAHFRLPFIGNVPIDISKIMGGGVRVKYNIDFITGNCLAQIYTIPEQDVMGDRSNDVPNSSYDGAGVTGCVVMIGQYAGNCAHKLPYSGASVGGSNAIGSLTTATLGAAAVGAGIALANPAMIAGGIGGAVSGLTNLIMPNTRPMTQNAIPNADTMGMLVPALIIERPMDLTPISEDGEPTVYEFFNGRPAAAGGTVKDYKSFDTGEGIFIQGVLHADTLYATESEKQEIEAAFAKGVYL